MKKTTKKGVYDAIRILSKAREEKTIEFEGGWKFTNKVELRTLSTHTFMDGTVCACRIYVPVEIDITDPEGNTRDIELFSQRNCPTNLNLGRTTNWVMDNIL